MGKNLVKTGRVIKVNPYDILSLYKYAKYHIQWESRELIKKLMEIYPYRKELGNEDYDVFYNYGGGVLFEGEGVEKDVSIHIPLNFLLLPVYIHGIVPPSYEYEKIIDVIEPDKNDVVDMDKLSLFNVYQVVDDAKGRINVVKLVISIEYRKDIRNYGIGALDVIADDIPTIEDPERLSILSLVYDSSDEEERIAKYLGKIRELQGKKYSEIGRFRDGIEWVEERLITTINLINALYTSKFDENDIIGWMLKQYSDTFKGFGCEFEDMLSSAAKVISAFLL